MRVGRPTRVFRAILSRFDVRPRFFAPKNASFTFGTSFLLRKIRVGLAKPIFRSEKSITDGKNQRSGPGGTMAPSFVIVLAHTEDRGAAVTPKTPAGNWTATNVAGKFLLRRWGCLPACLPAQEACQLHQFVAHFSFSFFGSQLEQRRAE